jgi:hypothetical protein
MVATGPFGNAVRLGAGALAGLTYAGDAEAAGGKAFSGVKKIVEKMKKPKTPVDKAELDREISAAAKAAGLRGERVLNYTGGIKDAIKNLDPKEMGRILRERYPAIGEPVLMVEGPKSYLSRGPTHEALWLQMALKEAQKDINLGKYQPYFDVSKRSYVDPSNYPVEGSTKMSRPVMDKTHEAWVKKYNTPETRQLMEEAYAFGKKLKNSEHWYALKQLEDEFIDELGPELGRKAFKKEMDAFAAVTGGMDPTSNLRLSHYARLLALHGEPLPTSMTEIPYPITPGKFGLRTNAMRFNDMEFNNRPLSPIKDPKRTNFRNNTLGYGDDLTIDDQMTKLYPNIKGNSPEDYAAAEEVMRDFLKSKGESILSSGQGILWFGVKRPEEAKPLIQIVNEAIERTSRITGLSPREVVRRHLIRKEGPLYGIGAASALDAPYNGEDNQSF